MKKSILISALALAALATTSCSNEETKAIEPQSNAIEFGTYLGRDAVSRGTVFDTDAMKTDGFGVFAVYTAQDALSAYTGTEANFMKNTKVTYTDPSWTYSPVKYWPNNTNDKVSFFAYAPYNSSKTCTLTSGNLIVPFTVANTVTDQIDLVWNNSEVTDLTKKKIAEKVNFKFQHALSKIGFTVAASVDEVSTTNNALDANTKIELKKIILSKDADGATGIFYTEGNLKLNNTTTSAVWSDQTGAQLFTLEASNNFVSNSVITLTSTNSTTPQQVNNDASYLMIIPQNPTFNVYVEYDVITTDPAGSDSSTITNKINNTATINFESGKAYTLKLVLGMTSVKIEATVADWATGSTTQVDLPINAD